MDDTSLVQQVQEGHGDAFGRLVGAHAGPIRAFVALGVPAHGVDEISQETFLFAYRHIHEFRRGRSFRAWLRSIAWNLIRADRQRYRRSRAHLAEYTHRRRGNEAGRSIGDKTEVILLESCLEELPERSRAILRMKYVEDRSAIEIGRELGRRPNWVRSTLFRLRQRVRRGLARKLAARGGISCVVAP